MSWDEFGFKKGELTFVAQNYETNKALIYSQTQSSI